YAARGWPARRPHAVLASSFVAVTALVPLSGYAVGSGKDHSALLFAASELIQHTSAASGSLLFAAGASVLVLAGLAASLRPQGGPPVALGLALLVTAAVSGGAVAFDAASTRAAAGDHLAADRSWIDDAHVGPVTFLRSPGTQGHAGIEQLFWNRSVDGV